jgi:cellobiose PTS system EIIC component
MGYDISVTAYKKRNYVNREFTKGEILMQNSAKSSWVTDKLMPPIMKFINTKAVTALKNGMVYSLPFIIIGSVFLILANVPYVPVATWLADHGWSAVFAQANNASFGMISIFTVVGIAYVYVRDEGQEALPAGFTALVAFLLLQTMSVPNPVNEAAYKNIDKLPHAVQELLSSPVAGVLNTANMGGQGMIAAIIVGLLVGWSYSAMIKAGWKVTLPEQVPANVAGQFTAMIPAFVVVTVSTAIFAIFKYVFHTDALDWIYQVIQTPLQGMSDSFPAVLLLAFLVTFFWFFGVHGGIIVGAISGAFLIPNSFDNMVARKAGELTLSNPSVHIVTNEFLNNFINMTGSGMTIGLVVFTLVRARSVQLKTLGKIELIPGLFNINEPFLFGIPMVLNPFLAIPFFLTPVIAAVGTYAIIYFGIVPPLNGVGVPWTTPPIISGLLAGGWQFAIWQAILIAMSTAMYFPFAIKYDKMLQKQETENAAAAEKAATN